MQEPAQSAGSQAPAPVQAPTPGAQTKPDPKPEKPLTLELLQASWPAIIEAIGEKKRTVWTALLDTEAVSLVEDIVTIGFPALQSAEVLKKSQGPGLPVNAELVRDAILAVTDHRVRFKVQEIVREAVSEPKAPESPPEMVAPAVTETPAEPVVSETASWPTISLPGAVEPDVKEADSDPEPSQGAPAEDAGEVPTSSLSQVGEAVIREVLGGELISEYPVDQPGDR
jgi:hypothetical protein